MKFYKRLLLTIPFPIFTFLYYRYTDPDVNCSSGTIDDIIRLFLGTVFLLTIILSFIGTVWKRKNGQSTFEPISFVIILITVLTLVFDFSFRGHTIGDKWLYAESETSSTFVNQNLTLRKNGNFTISLIDAGFDCSISGRFKQSNDTIFLELRSIDKTAMKMTPSYVLHSNKLIPIGDTTGRLTLRISSTE